MRKTKKLEDEKWLRTTAITNKQTKIISDSRRAKKILSSNRTKYLLDEKRNDKEEIYIKLVLVSYFIIQHKASSNSTGQIHFNAQAESKKIRQAQKQGPRAEEMTN